MKPSVEDVIGSAFWLLVDGCRGIYTAQSFIRMYGDNIMDMDDEVKDILDDGPDNDNYFDCVDDTRSCRIRSLDGHYHNVTWIDGDIFAYDQQQITDWEDEAGLDFWDEAALP